MFDFHFISRNENAFFNTDLVNDNNPVPNTSELLLVFFHGQQQISNVVKRHISRALYLTGYKG